MGNVVRRRSAKFADSVEWSATNTIKASRAEGGGGGFRGGVNALPCVSFAIALLLRFTAFFGWVARSV